MFKRHYFIVHVNRIDMMFLNNGDYRNFHQQDVKTDIT